MAVSIIGAMNNVFYLVAIARTKSLEHNHFIQETTAHLKNDTRKLRASKSK